MDEIQTNLLGRRVMFREQVKNAPNGDWAGRAKAGLFAEIVAVRRTPYANEGLMLTLCWDLDGVLTDVPFDLVSVLGR